MSGKELAQKVYDRENGDDSTVNTIMKLSYLMRRKRPLKSAQIIEYPAQKILDIKVLLVI